MMNPLQCFLARLRPARVSRPAKTPGPKPPPPMTAQQRLELQGYDAEVAARPDDAAPRLARAQFLERNGGDFAAMVGDLRAALRLRPAPDKWRNSRQLLKVCRENYRGLAWRDAPDARLRRANAVASFEVALELDDDCARWLAQRDEAWDALAVLQRAAGASYDQLQSEVSAPAELKMWALAVAIAAYKVGRDGALDADKLAARLNARACQLAQISEGGARQLTRTSSLADYQRLAGWNVLVEAAPDETRWLMGRGHWHQKRGDCVAARADFTRAIALAPDAPQFYEARAAAQNASPWGDINETRFWWDMAPDSQSAAADHARAIGLRIQTGEIENTPAALASEGARIGPRPDKYGHSSSGAPARAHAFYCLALQLDPDNSSYYLGRAQTLETWHFVTGQDTARQLGAAQLDYMRALARDETLYPARSALIAVTQTLMAMSQYPKFEPLTQRDELKYLVKTQDLMCETGMSIAPATTIIGSVLAPDLRNMTQRERIEALLRERAELRRVGAPAPLANALLVVIERVLRE